jgi:hypothetical protein
MPWRQRTKIMAVSNIMAAPMVLLAAMYWLAVAHH